MRLRRSAGMFLPLRNGGGEWSTPFSPPPKKADVSQALNAATDATDKFLKLAREGFR